MRAIKFAAASVILFALTGCVRLETSSPSSPSTGLVTSDGQCSQPGGVSVSIERDTVESFCVQGFTGTSWKLLQTVATVRGTDDYPDSFVCQINGWPKPSDNNCASSSSDFGYWNYYLSDGSSWQVANEGAATHVPSCGSAEAWKWISGPWTEQVEYPSISPKVFNCED